MARELNATETQLWWERLRHADEVWKKAGLHDQSDPDVHAKRSIDYYRGDQADGIGYRGIDTALGVVDNLTFSSLNTLVSSIYARNPRIDVIAERPDRKPNAEAMERVVNHLLASPRLRVRAELNRALWDAAIMKFGVVRHGFTLPEEKADEKGNLLETYDGQRPHFPWIARQAPWDFRADPLGPTLHPAHMAWCAFRDLYPMSVIKKSPAFIARSDLRPTRSLTDAKFRQKSLMQQGPDEHDLVEVWTVYDKVRRECFRLSPGSDKPISKANEWPIPWATLPCNVLQFNPTPDDPLGASFMDVGLAALQDDYNRISTLILELAKRQRRVILYNPSLMSAEEIEKLESLSLVEWVAVQDVNTAAREIHVGGNFQELLLLRAEIREAIRSLIGVGEMERGQRINVETAAEAQLVGQGAALQRGRNQAPFEDFLAESIETFARGIQATATQPLVVPIVGTESAAGLFSGAEGVSFDEIQPEAIQGEFQFRIRPGSTLPHDPNEQKRMELALNAALQPFGEIINMPQRAIDTVLAFEKDPAKQLLTGQQLMGLAEQRAAAPVQPGSEPGGGAPEQTGGVDAQLATMLNGGGGIQ